MPPSSSGCSPNTVAHYVEARDEGRLTSAPARRDQMIDDYADKLEEWVEASNGKVRADVVHDKLAALGYTGSERTTRRAVAAAKKAYRAGRRRLYRPWVPEPGMWFQFDWCDGPLCRRREDVAVLRLAGVVPLPGRAGRQRQDDARRSSPVLDQCLRRFGGVPTYALTDNEKTVTTDIVARIPVRHPELVKMGRHYGLSIATCVVADPESKGGSEATVRIAEADLVPTEANLLPAYRSFAELAAACEAFCDQVNARPHRATRRVPAEMLAEERHAVAPPARAALHRRVRRDPHGRGQHAGGLLRRRRVLGAAPVARRGGLGPPPRRRGRRHRRRAGGAGEVARHQRTTPGNPRYVDEHFGPAPEGRSTARRGPRPTPRLRSWPSATERRLWLTEAAAVGTSRVRAKMAEAVTLAALHGAAVVDRALGHAAMTGRFGEGDLASIIAHLASAPAVGWRRADESASLQAGTSAWEGFGRDDP